MSHALVPSAVTALLKNLLENGLVEQGIVASLGGEATVSSLPPDRIKIGEEERAQLNVYLYRTRVLGIEGLRPSNGTEWDVSQSVELSYVLSAYGAQELQWEMLLGGAMQILQDHACVEAAQMQSTLQAIGAPSGGKVVGASQAALAAPELAAQLHEMRISPLWLRPDEMMQLWSMLHATYRISAAYKVVVTLAAPQNTS
jgi:hypothetical protein